MKKIRVGINGFGRIGRQRVAFVSIVNWSVGREPEEIYGAYALGAAAHFAKRAKEKKMLAQLRIIRGVLPSLSKPEAD